MVAILFFKIRPKFFSDKKKHWQAITFHGLSLHSKAIAPIKLEK